MLVLSRFQDQTVVITVPGQYMANGVPLTINVMAVDIRGSKMRIGFDAPKFASVHRQEVFDEIQRQQENAVPKVSVSP